MEYAIGQPVVPDFLSGGGEMGERIRTYDWSKTSLGPIENWPRSLRTCIRIMLTSRQPIWIGWGKELIKFYNDPYKTIVGGKHPHALGSPASVVWRDIWKDIEPMLKQVMEKDEGTYVESQLLIMVRNGYPEETYYTFSYTPIPGDEGGTAGMICANTDDTDRIISERQLKTLTQLSTRLTDSRSNEEIISKTISTLHDNPHDFPFALFYSISDNKASLSRSTELGNAEVSIPRTFNLNDNSEIAALFRNATATKQMQIIDDLKKKLGEMPKGAWEIAPDKALILPVIQASAKEPFGFLVVGFNPYRLLNEKYSSFFSLIADQVATSFADVHILEEERKRAEALAEIDRAKTIFFSNISHEFRTPLTLLLGPIEDVVQSADSNREIKRKMEVAYRNALRMQKLVNTLLDFSRIEAGRMEGKFTKVDICQLTEDLASTFRSAVEKAGMRLEFQCEKTESEVYVDVDMWEKIVLNLISNAFKYSREGVITVGVKQVKDEIQVTVRDSGIGIPAAHLDKIFERFHRVENTDGRSQEGTGIGLAMVKELVKIHHGSISVSSEQGKGSVFTVTIPAGGNHLSPDKIIDISNNTGPRHSAAFLEEALKWVPSQDEIHSGALNDNPEKYQVLLADDNADMRDYVQRLLSEQFSVITADNGEEAFRKMVKHKPDLLLSDIMMPRLDGFGLLKKVRQHPEIKNTPVIFLSARAGEEAKVEGLDAGADDYLIKPFSAKELMARVTHQVRISGIRQQIEQEVLKRTAELQRSNYELQQFAHVASHDLKEPIRKVKTFLARLEEDLESTLSHKGKTYINKASSAANRMSMMVEGVLNYSMTNAAEHHIETIDLNDTIKDIQSDLELIIRERSATIHCSTLPSIEGAAVLIYQLFYNLLNNSLKFVRPEADPVISITSTISGSHVEINITDNGVGFEQEQAEKIFTTFTRLHSKDRFEGTGLGLSLCKRIAERHGGTITATGKVNEGSTFTIRLPLKQHSKRI